MRRLAWAWGAVAGLAAQAAWGQEAATYANPLPVVSAAHGPVESCADPSVIAGPAGDPHWYMVCTTDPLNDEDRDANGDHVFHLVPMFRSADLVHWEYQGDAFDRDPATATPDPPAWMEPDAALWAPEIDEIGGRWYLFLSVTAVRDEAGGEPGCDEDSAIGHAVSDSPLGPWVPAPAPLVPPRRTDPGCEFLWTLDPEVIEGAGGRHHLYLGSFHGGIEVRDLLVAPDGSLSASEDAVQVVIPNRYEGAEVIQRDGWYYLFASATNCCAGPQTGYAVFAGRSRAPTGPFLDREGVSLLDASVGGTPVTVQNGNRWVGPGHNSLIEDRAGQWWTLYHAVDKDDPYFAGAVGFTKRPLLLDRLDWVDGRPVTDGGAGPSDGPRPAPAVQPGQVLPPATPAPDDGPGAPLPELSDDFDGAALGSGWTWLREPGAAGVSDGVLRRATDAGDLHEDSDDAAVLLREAPAGDYLVETAVRLDVPATGCCFNYVQAGLVIHGDDDNYVKLVLASIWETRQTEFARELAPVPEGFPRYGNTVVGPPGADWTHLRIAVRRGNDSDSYTAYTSRDGVAWTRGGTWTHDLGDGARLGLVAMGGAGFTAEFDAVRVSRLDR